MIMFLETKGDTLVVKDEFDYGAPGALQLLMDADTLNVPAGRVYQLHNNGYYSVISRPTFFGNSKSCYCRRKQRINKK